MNTGEGETKAFTALAQQLLLAKRGRSNGWLHTTRFFHRRRTAAEQAEGLADLVKHLCAEFSPPQGPTTHAVVLNVSVGGAGPGEVLLLLTSSGNRVVPSATTAPCWS
jgi:hypothetical protein